MNKWLTFAIFASLSAQAAVTVLPSALKPPSTPTIDVMVNGSFEARKAAWTASSGSTFTIDTSAPLNGGASGVFTATAGSQTVTSAQYVIPEGLKGAPCSASTLYKSSEATNKYTLSVIDGSLNVLTSSQIPSPVSQAQKSAVYFQCPTSGTMAFRLTSSGSASALKWDDVTLGKNNLIQVGQATWLGSLSMDQASGCQWSNGTSAWLSFLGAPVSGCNAPVVTGNAVSAGKVPAVTFNNLSQGEYLVSVNAPVQANAGTVSCSYRIYDGSTAVAQNIYSTANSVTLSGHYTYTGAQSTKTFELQSYDEAGSDACVINLSNLGTNATLTWNIYKFPSQVEQAVRPETINWRISAQNISNTDIGLNAAGVSNVDIPTTGASVNIASDSGTMPVLQTCSGTEQSASSTCSGTADLGLSFNLPATQTVHACVSVVQNITNNANSNASASEYYIAETPDNAQTVLQRGTNSAIAGAIPSAASGAGLSVKSPVLVCSDIPFSSSGKKTLRLFSTLPATSQSQGLMINGSGSVAQWTITPITQNVPAPILVGSVTSPSAGVEVVARARYDNLGVITSQSGNWITRNSHSADGVNSWTITPGTFSGDPTCHIDVYDPGLYYARWSAGPTATDLSAISTYIPTAVNNNVAGNIICIGPK